MKKDNLKKIKIAIGVALLLTTLFLFIGFMEGEIFSLSNVIFYIVLSIIGAIIVDIVVGCIMYDAFWIAKKIFKKP